MGYYIAMNAVVDRILGDEENQIVADNSTPTDEFKLDAPSLMFA
jgi:hypothetical protein